MQSDIVTNDFKVIKIKCLIEYFFCPAISYTIQTFCAIVKRAQAKTHNLYLQQNNAYVSRRPGKHATIAGSTKE